MPHLTPPLSNSKTVPMFPKDQELSRNFLALRANQIVTTSTQMIILNFIIITYTFYNNMLYYMQEKSGIQRDKPMADKLVYIPNDDTQNFPFCRLKLVVETLEHYGFYQIAPVLVAECERSFLGVSSSYLNIYNQLKNFKLLKKIKI